MSENRLEEAVRERLSGNNLENALDFAAFMRANGLSPEFHDSGDGWSIMRGNQSIGFILVNGAEEAPGPWTIWFNSCDFDDSRPVDEAVKETAWAHACICGHFSSGGKECGCGDQPGFRRTIFGRVFENRCHSPLMFLYPDARTLKDIQELLLLLR